MATEAEIQALIDKDAIRDVIYREARAVDRKDTAIMKTCYHADATADYGRYSKHSEKVSEHFATNDGVSNYLDMSHHHIGNIIIDLDVDSAAVETYLFDTLRLVKTDGTPPGQQIMHQLFIRYLDRFEKRDGAWRIARRVVVQDMSDSRTAVEFDYGFRQGTSDKSDVVYDPMRK